MSATWISYPELAALIGTDMARTMCCLSGGVSMYVPRTPNSDTALGRILGVPALRCLCSVYGGDTIVVPNGRKPEARKEAVMTLLEDGVPLREIALQLGVTERYVQMIARVCRAPRQLSLLSL